MIFKTGDIVRLTVDGREVNATVVIASGNGQSLMLQFDALLSGWAGMMPVIDRDGSGNFEDLTGRTVEITAMQ